MNVRPPPSKQIGLILFGSHVLMTGLLAAVGMTRGARDAMSREGIPPVVLIAVSGGAAVACVAVCFLKLRPRGQMGEKPVPPPAAEFQTYMMVALAFAELPTLMGFMGQMSGRVSILPFAAVSLALMLGVVLPPVLAYWGRAEGS